MTKLCAEIASNHGGSRAWMAEAIIGAKDAGCDIIKGQSFQVKTLRPGDPQADWLAQAELSLDDLDWFRRRCVEVGIEPLMTVFDLERPAQLREMGYQAVKIGSGDAMRADLVSECVRLFPRVYVSTGLLDGAQRSAVALASSVVAIHAVTRYPCPLDAVNMERSGVRMPYRAWGYSSHTVGMADCQFAVALGASYVEKHLRLDTGRQSAWDATLDQFRALSEWRDACRVMAGDGRDVPNPEAVAKFQGRWQHGG